MVQPKTPPLSIRPGADRMTAVDAYAAKHKLTRHAAVLALIDAGLGGNVKPSDREDVTALHNANAQRDRGQLKTVSAAQVRKVLRMPRAPVGSLAKKGKAK